MTDADYIQGIIDSKHFQCGFVPERSKNRTDSDNYFFRCERYRPFMPNESVLLDQQNQLEELAELFKIL